MPDIGPPLDPQTQRFKEYLAAEHRKGTHAQQREREVIDAHLTALKNQAELRKKSAHRQRIANGKGEQYDVDVSDTDAALATALKAEAKRTPPLAPGQLVPGKGIFICEWTPKERDGETLSETFNVFGAPKDLIDTATGIAAFSYDVAIRRIDALKNVEGHDGAHYYSDRDLIAALKNGNYNGGWVMPPIELLSGYDIDDNLVQPDNLASLKDKEAFKDAFGISRGNDKIYLWYWSSSTPKDLLASRGFKFNGERGWIHKNSGARARPVRFEKKP